MTAAAPEPGDDLPDGGPSRGNGLTAGSFVPLLDVDPRVSEALLEALAAVGIAACVRPRPTAEGGGLDRLLVDDAYVDAARLVAERELRQQASLGGPGSTGPADAMPPSEAVPEPARRDVSAEEVDTAWAAIVAGFDTPTADRVPRWPASEDVSPDSSVAAAEQDADPAVPPRRRRSGRAHGRAAPESAREHDDGGHYRPPPAPPVGRLSRYTTVALLVMLAGLALVVAPSVVGLGSSTGVLTLGVLLLTGGAGALVVRMSNGAGPDSGPDDGAVV